ncbi:sensor histidine kinase [Georgenia subflava]|uniref:histidine kinase n=1 Tax=Georgenia subflava TaxID=1622177 RepID=A0A6N7EC11_9MICO|nr:sensor histidine kinase [Georgenia subflava]MPV35510.1 GHKL domain-containing protein [Georgenia subflava]
MTVAGQLLLLQLLVVLLVVVVVGGLSFSETGERLARAESRRSLSAAETLAANPTVRALLPTAVPGGSSPLAAVGETVRTVSGATTVTLMHPDRTVVTSSDPAAVGTELSDDGPGDTQGRSWAGSVHGAAVAEVPVLDDEGQVIGTARIGRLLPSLSERLGAAGPGLLVYVGLATSVGVVGSTMLSRRIKRQTLGLEPTEIAGLVEHREALLHGIREGVIALDTAGRVTLLNDAARRLLGLPPDTVGRPLPEVTCDPELLEALTEDAAAPDRLVVVGARLLVLNRMPVRSHGSVIGSVTTMRDQTEMQAMERALDSSRRTTGTLRAQTHEFSNQLHTISGLLQLEEYEEVVRFVEGVSNHRDSLYLQVTERISDLPVAALLIAKDSLAAERGARLVVDEASSVSRVDDELSRDLVTVVGNLIDNALDAVAGGADPRVEVTLTEDEEAVTVQVHDTGPGVDVPAVERLFRSGYTTKRSARAGGRGYGLALVRLVCRRRGGEVTVRNDDDAGGAVFTAKLPKTPAEVAR